MAILNNIQRKIILNSGHWGQGNWGDPGVSVNNFVEREECKKIRDIVRDILIIKGYNVVIIPDEMNLVDSIAMANKENPNLSMGINVDVHLNCSYSKNG